MNEKQLLDAAVKALKIDRPILRHEIKGRTVKLWLLGGDGYTGREQNTLFPLESVLSVSLYRTAAV